MSKEYDYPCPTVFAHEVLSQYFCLYRRRQVVFSAEKKEEIILGWVPCLGDLFPLPKLEVRPKWGLAFDALELLVTL